MCEKERENKKSITRQKKKKESGERLSETDMFHKKLSDSSDQLEDRCMFNLILTSGPNTWLILSILFLVRSNCHSFSDKSQST